MDELTQAIGEGDWASKIFEIGVTQLQFQNQLKSQKVANAAQTAAGVDGQRTASTVADKTAAVQKALPWVAGAAAVLLLVWMMRK